MSRNSVQQAIANYGLPVGLALLVIFGVYGVLTDSTIAGVLAGIGLGLVLGSFALRRR